MTQRERALELYTKFQVYYWHEVDGYLPNNEKTLKTCVNVVDEIIMVVKDIIGGDGWECDFWEGVKKELKKI